MKDYTDEQLANLRRGGHDPSKVYNAYLRAVNHVGAPTVILAKTVKGYGLGEGGEGRNATHQQKKLTEPQIQYFYKRFDMKIPEEKVKKLEFFRPAEDSPEAEYIKKRVEAMGGPLPARVVRPFEFKTPALELFAESLAGSGSSRGIDDIGIRRCSEGAAEERSRRNSSFRSFPTKRARSAWTRCSARSASMRARASCTRLSIKTW